MITLKLLNTVDIETIHEAFVDAFSDYQVKMNLPLSVLSRMLQRRGYRPEFSIGAFDDDRLVGFILNGIRDWNGKLTAYDTGTGVIPDYRRKGITTKMFSEIKNVLVENNIEQYLLEVLKPNESAIQLYLKQGFEIQREFLCLILNKDDINFKPGVKVDTVDRIEWDKVKEFWDFESSWQNSIESIETMPDAFRYYVVNLDEAIVGYGIVDKVSGDIPQIAVKKEYRNRGIGTSIMAEMAKGTESGKLSILNVDSKEKPMEDFLLKLGFTHHVGQYEMLLSL